MRYILLGILFSVPSFLYGGIRNDSLVLERMFCYRRNFACEIEDTTTNIYLKLAIKTNRRNFTMMCVPTLFHVAYGDRDYITENYGKVKFKDIRNYDLKHQIYVSTIRHRSSSTMTVLRKYIVPDVYGIAMFEDQVLSPFNRANRVYYRYTISEVTQDTHLITFKPRSNNTQLVKGYAIVNSHSGRLNYARFQGEYDMLNFDIQTYFDEIQDDRLAILPRKCVVNTTFKFLGNDLRSNYTALFGCDTNLPDSIERSADMKLLSDIRPIPLDSVETDIYRKFFSSFEKPDTVATDNKKKKSNIGKIAWDILEDNMLSSIRGENDKGYFKLSPIINPEYITYSNSRGVAYKITLGAQYNFNEKRKLSFNSRTGYNFKIKQFYFDNRLHFDFNPKRNGWLELQMANGNRINNSSVLDLLNEQHRDTVDFSKLNLDYFNDNHYELSCNIAVTDEFEVMPSIIYHHRTAVNKNAMVQTGQPTEYNGFASSLTLKYQPFKSWPMFSLNYERCFNDVFGSNMEYERWELDASYRRRYSSLKRFNARLGGGFYTNKSTTYFIDYNNFHEDYLPGGWDDDWSGEFQLLNSRWYNASNYYLRMNVSYDSPLLLISRLPFAGRIFEAERLYFSFAQLEKTRAYYEVGYGFKTRFISLAFFGSFLNADFVRFGTKFSFELFRKW
ncbi:MAG: DUF5686 family protein [Prevotella sp.]